MRWQDADRRRLSEALAELTERLLAERSERGHWRGELSSSALSTATASFALALVAREREARGEAGSAELRELVRRGLDWLARHANPDGGWGDTVRSASNASTTTLSWAALRADPEGPRHAAVIDAAERWLEKAAGSLEPEAIARTIIEAYGADRTFSVPILTHCALAGRLGEGSDAWRRVLQLPFELAAFPRRWYRALGLPVVSYALPALIAVGIVRHRNLPARNPLLRAARGRVEPRTLSLLEEIQPRNGGFLEATPLTSFVTMSLAGSGLAGHPVARRAVDFLARSPRHDGSWPIDTDLATWLTTLSVNALWSAGRLDALREDERRTVLEWLLAQQYRTRHPYTDADPGGWAWTDLPGGVPDADDTSGALLAIARLEAAARPSGKGAGRERLPGVEEAGRLGLRWLLDLQNRDGGIPTFCRGWGKLPFDRSGPDLTAHALRALLVWRSELRSDGGLDGAHLRRIDGSIRRGTRYLEGSRRDDGSWAPLWFGNEDAPGFENPTYGTSRVLLALEAIVASAIAPKVDVAGLHARGAQWITDARNADGGWGGAPGLPSSVEETALAVDALAGAPPSPDADTALREGALFLAGAVEEGALDHPSPIGFYFANLWYFEKLYPVIFTLSALGRAARRLGAGAPGLSRSTRGS